MPISHRFVSSATNNIKTIFKSSGLFIFSLLAGAVPSEARTDHVPGPPVEISGQVHVLYADDFERHTAEVQHLIEDDKTGKLHRLRFRNQTHRDLKSGHKMLVRGHMVDDMIDVAESSLSAFPEMDNTIGTTATTQSVINRAVRRAVVLIVDLNDAFASSRYTKSQIQGIMYGNSTNVDGLYNASSSGLLDFDPDGDGDLGADIFGPFRINASATICDPYGWAYKAEAAAVAAGVNLSRYEHRIFVLPRYNETACTWAGKSNVGCGLVDQHKNGFCRAWIAEAESGMVFAHEIGHNLGMAHAATDHNNDGVIDSEYGDNSDPMAISRAWRVFNAPHMHQMGWFDGFANTILDVSGSISTSIFPIERSTSCANGQRGLRIPKNDTGEFYYVSYRRALGGYCNLESNYKDRINIHRFLGSGYSNTVFIASLAHGASFVDSINGITVTNTGLHGNGSMGVSVSLACVKVAPSLTVQPPVTAIQSNESALLGVTIVNNNGPGCGVSSFAVMTLEKPLLSTSTGFLAPGAAWSREITAAGSLFPKNSKNTITFLAGGITGGISQSKAVIAVDDLPPTTPVITNLSFWRKGLVVVDWIASQDNPGGSGIDYYAIYRNGLLRGTTRDLSFRDSGAVVGDSFKVVAFDLAGNSTPSSELTADSYTRKPRP